MLPSLLHVLLAVSTLPSFGQTPQPAQAPTAPPPSPPPAVKVGEAAPEFSLPYLAPKPDGGFETRQFSLAAVKGKQNVVVAFFPAAFSPG
jgi:hypothetical protein